VSRGNKGNYSESGVQLCWGDKDCIQNFGGYIFCKIAIEKRIGMMLLKWILGKLIVHGIDSGSCPLVSFDVSGI
jgi:hypothetical protein